MMIENPLQIAPMTGEHLSEVLAIEKSSFRDPWSPVSFLDSIGEPPASWVVLENERVAGYLVTLWVCDEIHILNFAVREDLRQRGIGTCLMDFLLQKAHTQGIRAMLLEVRRSNQAAIEFYQKNGFQPLYHRKAYYSDGEDACIMECRSHQRSDSAEEMAKLHQNRTSLSR
jgi:ribosomal-protein-alanine acetyltransferase